MRGVGVTFVTIVLLMLLTAQSGTFYVHAQPIRAATPFEQLAQGQGQPPQPIPTTASTAKPGTILLTTFPNGTSKAQFVNGTTVQVLNGVGYLVLDPRASAVASASASAPVSNTVVNRIYQAIAIAIGITINNNTIPPPPPLPPQPNQTEPGAPDERCLFDPSLPHCTPPPGEDCPAGFGTNEDGQCFPLGGCPDGYHSVEDDESGTCYPDDIPCPDGQVKSDEGNFCIMPPEPTSTECDEGFALNPSTGQCEPISDITLPSDDGQQQAPPPLDEPGDENGDANGGDDESDGSGSGSSDGGNGGDGSDEEGSSSIE
jgi:hypothetical protein